METAEWNNWRDKLASRYLLYRSNGLSLARSWFMQLRKAYVHSFSHRSMSLLVTNTHTHIGIGNSKYKHIILQWNHIKFYVRYLKSLHSKRSGLCNNKKLMLADHRSKGLQPLRCQQWHIGDIWFHYRCIHLHFDWSKWFKIFLWSKSIKDLRICGNRLLGKSEYRCNALSQLHGISQQFLVECRAWKSRILHFQVLPA